MPPRTARPQTGQKFLDEAKKGTAELLILAVVEHRGLHGYEIGRQIEVRSEGTLKFTMASLYATLYRIEDRGWIRGRWIEKAGQRRRCHYTLTEAARDVLAAQRKDWGRFLVAVRQVAGVKPA